jgi:hypothetical protein
MADFSFADKIGRRVARTTPAPRKTGINAVYGAFDQINALIILIFL